MPKSSMVNIVSSRYFSCWARSCISSRFPCWPAKSTPTPTISWRCIFWVWLCGLPESSSNPPAIGSFYTSDPSLEKRKGHGPAPAARFKRHPAGKIGFFCCIISSMDTNTITYLPGIIIPLVVVGILVFTGPLGALAFSVIKGSKGKKPTGAKK